MFLCLETDFFICDFLQNALHFSYLKTMEKLTKLKKISHYRCESNMKITRTVP